MHPNEELARRELEVINSGGMEPLADLYAEDYVLHTRGGKISEVWIHIGDQYGLDDFLNSLDSA